MNKPYLALDCPNYTEINTDLLDYIKKYTNLLTNNPHNSDTYDPVKTPVTYPNFLEKFGYNVLHFAKANPKLIKWLTSVNLVMRDVYFTVAWAKDSPLSAVSSCPIHIDKPPVYWKLNWPVLNMEHTAIRFFKAKDPTVDINTLITRDGNPNSKDKDHYQLQYEDFEEFDRYRLNECRPVIMNGQIPHDVGFYENPVFPRIGLQVMFFKEPVHLL